MRPIVVEGLALVMHCISFVRAEMEAVTSLIFSHYANDKKFFKIISYVRKRQSSSFQIIIAGFTRYALVAYAYLNKGWPFLNYL